MNKLIVLIFISFVATSSHDSPVKEDKPQSPGSVQEEGCYKELGCFKKGGNFFDTLDFLPQDREVIGVKFRLYTQKNKKNHVILEIDSIESPGDSLFSASRETKILIPGYFHSLEVYGDWMKDMKNALLEQGDYNVITTDWSGGNTLNYPQAVANTELVGAEIAALIKFLQKTTEVSPSAFHLIGHSLGAHVAGYTGERIDKIGRITGLDPSGLYFNGMPTVVRLDPSDAQFVDVIHTDTGSDIIPGNGIEQSVGHLDFYPNNGDTQPGCILQPLDVILRRGLIKGFQQLVACDHIRSIHYFLDSINDNTCEPIGVACDTWRDFINGNCIDCGEGGRNCAFMGFKADKLRQYKNETMNKKFYLTTRSTIPYCLYHYQVVVELANHPDSETQMGELYIIMEGEKDNLESLLSEGNERFQSGAQYSYLVTSKRDIGQLKGITISWSQSLLLFLDPDIWSMDSDKEHMLFLSSVKIIRLSINSREKKADPFLFCVDSKSPLRPGNKTSLLVNEVGSCMNP
ncbi:pancreatic triacylglycerol lipase-like [Limulus polyphemus]|uniref:Pancreatic triacylglycerol lipase-like n=1 Tax=Limulus polyphemus TaxID=6850 RepID=A0ABM1B6T6_LIMPO|nr:pancreatic triacylglycerol lipase-like [Limulus polyphemus]